MNNSRLCLQCELEAVCELWLTSYGVETVSQHATLSHSNTSTFYAIIVRAYSCAVGCYKFAGSGMCVLGCVAESLPGTHLVYRICFLNLPGHFEDPLVQWRTPLWIEIAALYCPLLAIISTDLLVWEIQWQTVSLCSTGLSPSKTVPVNYLMKTGLMWSPQNVSQYRTVR